MTKIFWQCRGFDAAGLVSRIIGLPGVLRLILDDMGLFQLVKPIITLPRWWPLPACLSISLFAKAALGTRQEVKKVFGQGQGWWFSQGFGPCTLSGQTGLQ